MKCTTLFKQIYQGRVFWMMFGLSLATVAQIPWSLVGGKKDVVVNSVHPITEDHIMLATESGIFYYEYEAWQTVLEGIPVRELKSCFVDKRYAAVGDGSDKDGIYNIRVTGIGDPGVRYGAFKVARCPRPKTVAFRMLYELYDGVLFAGGNDGMFSGVMQDMSLSALAPVTGGELPEGAQVNTLIWSNGDEYVYTATQGSGGDDPGWLLAGTFADSAWHRLETTPYKERCLAHLSGKRFWIGTDSGAYRLDEFEVPVQTSPRSSAGFGWDEPFPALTVFASFSVDRSDRSALSECTLLMDEFYKKLQETAAM